MGPRARRGYVHTMFFYCPATTEIYSFSLHVALPILVVVVVVLVVWHGALWTGCCDVLCSGCAHARSGVSGGLCRAFFFVICLGG